MGRPTINKKLTPAFDLIRPALLLLQEHYLAFTYIVFLPGLTYTLGTLLSHGIHVENKQVIINQQQIIGLVLVGVAAVWTLSNIGPALALQLQAVTGKPLRLRDYYRRGLPKTLKLIFLYGCIGLLVVGGLILLIFPGLIAIRRYILAPYYFMDQPITITEALRRSAEDSLAAKEAIWGVIGIQLLAGLIGFAAELITRTGIIVSIIATNAIYFVIVLRYREINPLLIKPKRQKHA